MLDGFTSIRVGPDGEFLKLVDESVAAIDGVNKDDGVKVLIRRLDEAADAPDEVRSEDSDRVFDKL